MRNKGKWIQRMMFSYLPLFFIMISILVFIFFLSVNNIAEQENKRANEQFALQSLQLLDNEMYALNQRFLDEIYFSPETQLFFNAFYAEDISLNYALIQKLQSFVRSTSLVDSVYLYRATDGNVLSDAVMIEAQLYPDIAFVEQGEPEVAWSGYRMFQDFADTNSRAVVSSKKPYPLTGAARGTLVLNINLGALQQRFAEIGRVDLSFAYVQDAEGRWLLGNLTPQAAESLSPDVALPSGITGWTLYSGLNEHYLFGTLQLISRIWIVAGLAIILVGFAWLIYLIRRSYRPVEALASQIESYSLRKSMELRGNYDEFKFIEQALHGLLEEAQTHHLQLAESMTYKEKYLFDELLEGSPSLTAEELASILAGKGFDPASQGWRFLLVEMDHFRSFEAEYSRQDQLLLKFALTSVLKELADQHGLPLWAEWVADNQVAALIGMEADEEGRERQERETLQTFYEACLRWVQAHLSFTVTIAEGARAERIEEVYLSYDSARDIIRFKPTIGSNQWLDATRVKRMTGVGYYQLFPEVHALTESFRTGKASWREGLAAIGDSIREHQLSRKDIVHLFEYLLHKLSSELQDIAEAKGQYWSERESATMQEAIDTFDTVEELVQTTSGVLGEVFARMLEWREQHGNAALIAQAEAYIAQHYGDDALSLNGISDVFGMHPTSFSRAFKQATGEKFVDYVTRIRIEQAKRALTASDTSIQEIGQSVGYVHAVSFNRAFKKAVGLTPGDYRRQARE
ncbi:AraC family transcriptional regulator [Paenibacillus sp. 598K]|uniref:helix-turn-helix domain-containing protein n=1 Tax=Paenibacillus sp. 598K TaxID=1117987 RepID=UPI000FFA94C9|nr:helix-turn-helix domain-containing protein [Paenibacillus sp. 598K]GBF76706.1 AraC family transcriptional regulator [Paenibacillus sp. 598K]